MGKSVIGIDADNDQLVTAYVMKSHALYCMGASVDSIGRIYTAIPMVSGNVWGSFLVRISTSGTVDRTYSVNPNPTDPFVINDLVFSGSANLYSSGFAFSITDINSGEHIFDSQSLRSSSHIRRLFRAGDVAYLVFGANPAKSWETQFLVVDTVKKNWRWEKEMAADLKTEALLFPILLGGRLYTISQLTHRLYVHEFPSMKRVALINTDSAYGTHPHSDATGDFDLYCFFATDTELVFQCGKDGPEKGDRITYIIDPDTLLLKRAIPPLGNDFRFSHIMDTYKNKLYFHLYPPSGGDACAVVDSLTGSVLATIPFPVE